MVQPMMPMDAQGTTETVESNRKKIKHICRAVDSSHPAPQRFWTNAGHGIQHQERFFQPHIEVD